MPPLPDADVLPTEWRAAHQAVAGLGGLVLSGAPWIALALGTGLLLLVWTSRSAQGAAAPQELSWVMGLLALAALLASITEQIHWPQALSLPASMADWKRWGKLLVWFTWPAWPLALWTLWRWRHQLRSPHVALPLWAALVSVVNSAINPDFDRSLLLALPALAVLAAFALPTLRRSVSALIDWFTLLFFTVSALAIWVIWIAMQTGVPAKPAANVAKLAPGFVPQFSALALVVALAATVGWCSLVWWRAARNRAPIWKSLVLPASGAALGWLLLMTLWLPLLDYARSYRPQVRSVMAALGPSPGCVQTVGLNRAQVAALQYHGGLSLQRAGLQDECDWLVADIASWPPSERMVNVARWEARATIPRPTDKNDHLLVFHRAGPAR